MKPMHLGVAVLLLGAAVGCRHDADKASPPHVSTSRILTPFPAETLWMRGGRKEDVVLKYPEYLAHDRTQLYVSDAVARQIVALDQITGQTRWESSHSGAGLRDPGSIAGLPGGGVAVLDAAGTLAVIDEHGRSRSSASLIDGQIARQICALSDTTFVVAFMREHLPLAIITATGTTLKRIELPWAEVSGMTAMQTQVILAGSSANRCIVGLAYGGGLASIRGGAVEWSVPYIEHIPLPGVKATTIARQDAQVVTSAIAARHVAARDITVDDSVVDVIFEGVERKPGSLIDEYDARTGAYLRTRTASRRAVGIQRNGNRAFLLAGLAGYPVLVAVPIAAGAH